MAKRRKRRKKVASKMKGKATISKLQDKTFVQPTIKASIPEPEVHTVELVYLGIANKATVRGKVTGQKYQFTKNEYNMPLPTTVNDQDAPGVLALEGKPCCGRPPHQLFITKVDWDADIDNAKRFNRESK